MVARMRALKCAQIIDLTLFCGEPVFVLGPRPEGMLCRKML